MTTFTKNNILLQYYGYAASHSLWLNDPVCGLEQLVLPTQNDLLLKEPIDDKMRLGFRVERFIFSDLESQDGVEILAKNIQVKGKKRTIGELDCLILKNGKPIHLEIIFKLYLYDPELGHSEIDKWVGGNRWDSLAKKLNKLKTKQLPLLYHPKTEPILKSLNLAPEDFEQRVLFKAQLYLPFQTKVDFELLNKDCVKGFYIKPEELHRFSRYRFHIPIKNDWLIEPQLDVDWLDFEQYKIALQKFEKYKSYTLSWIKYPDGSCEKFFVVWWVSSL